MYKGALCPNKHLKMSDFTTFNTRSSTADRMTERDFYAYRSVSPPMSPSASTTASPFLSHKPPDDTSTGRQEQKPSAHAKRQKYLRRLLKFKQMDFEYAFWQMIYLFVAPQKVYRNFQYRKNTKNQWARDDPAFLVLLSFWLFVSSIGFAVYLRLQFVGFLKFILWVIFVDCIGVGLCIATFFWFVTNRYMITAPPRGQDVEWGYAFDVHLNAFFPLLMILHLFQLVFLHPIIIQDWFLGRFVGNTLWLIAVGYYIYITFLGYSGMNFAFMDWLACRCWRRPVLQIRGALPFLKNTRPLLFPIMAVLLVYILSLALNWNFSQGLCNFYHYRVGES